MLFMNQHFGIYAAAKYVRICAHNYTKRILLSKCQVPEITCEFQKLTNGSFTNQSLPTQLHIEFQWKKVPRPIC